MSFEPSALRSPLDFRCTSCGNCCRTLRVALTTADLARLVRATGRPPLELASFLAPEEVDMTGEPQSFIELDAGRRLMVLSHEASACRLLGADNRCTAYAARPRDCRAYPFDFGLPHDRQRLALLPLVGCEYGHGGQQVERELRENDDARWEELAEHQRLVARWNRRAFHRRRLGRSVGDVSAYLQFVGLGAVFADVSASDFESRRKPDVRESSS